jgi:hypothetical protein
MRLSNDRDQALIRSAVSDAATSLLTFVPSLGTGEVFVFGPGVALPMRMKFRNLPDSLRPASEVGLAKHVQADAGLELISSVIDRWRNATMSSKQYDEDGFDSQRDEFSALQTTPMQSPAMQPAQPAGGFDPQRSRLLKQPLSATLGSSDSPKPWRS